jgi:hypothetical protein
MAVTYPSRDTRGRRPLAALCFSSHCALRPPPLPPWQPDSRAGFHGGLTASRPRKSESAQRPTMADSLFTAMAVAAAGGLK